MSTFQGSPCRKGHDGVRYIANRACVACNNSHAQSLKYKDYYRRASAERREAVRQLVRAAKSQPCFDCGGSFPWYVTEFDHREGRDGGPTVAALLGYGVQRVQLEMAKCDVVCANCHRARTHSRAVAEGRWVA